MSVLAKEIQKNFETSNEFLETGFQYAQKAGEYLAEAQELSGENFETWLNENCSFDLGTAQKLIDFFNGEYIEVSAIHRTEKEVQKE
jgi:hypothetical protein